MKTIIGALALALSIPAAAQTAPATDPHAGHAQHQAVAQQGQQHQGHAKQSMEEMHKNGQEMMKHHGKEHGAKSGKTPAASGHEGHAH